METEIENLRLLCSEVYQIIGAMTLGSSINITNDDIEKVLDNLSAAAQGSYLPHKTLLPWPKNEEEING